MSTHKKTRKLIRRLDALLDRVETLLPPRIAAPDWDAFTAFQWRPDMGTPV